MPRRKPSKWSLNRFRKKFHQATGITFNALIKGIVFLAIAVAGISWTVWHTNAEQEEEAYRIGGVVSKRMTAEEQFAELSSLPPDFSEKQAVEKVDILKSKIRVGEELAISGGRYSERVRDQLVTTYGDLCQLEDAEGINSEKTYVRLAELRQQADATGNKKRVASADYQRALSATKRLNRYFKKADFRFATDTILNLENKNLVDAEKITTLCSAAIDLHEASSEQTNTTIFLSVLGDKLASSPVSEISDQGLSLKDYARYARFYDEIVKQTHETRDSKLQVYRELFAEIEKSPPHAARTYQDIFRLLDRLVNETDASFARKLTGRLDRAASMMSPKIISDVEQSIKNIEKRIASLERTVNFSGSDFKGSPVQLPNGKPTTLVFWRFGNMASTKHVESVADSGRYAPSETNVMFACVSPLNEDQFTEAKATAGELTVLDNETSSRIRDEIGIDIVPYHVSLDKDGKVIRLGEPAE